MKNNNNLIFLISQPRAGSTLIQRILGCHGEIYTTSEPWIMLHPLYALKEKGIETEYSCELALKGLSDFLSPMENGRALYLENMRTMYGNLYSERLRLSGKQYFLDKTPRYYFIIEELHELFPDAKFIFLIRNPLAVLSSILKTWVHEDWFKLGVFGYDLLEAPDYLLKGMRKLGASGLCLHYEQVLLEPEREIRKVCDYLGIEFKREMIDYGNFGLPKWDYGDQGTVYEKSRPDPLHADQWLESLKDPGLWRFFREYLDYLGEEKIHEMGYSFRELDSVCTGTKPSEETNKASAGLLKLLDNGRNEFLKNKQLWEQLGRAEKGMKEQTELNTVLQHRAKEALDLAEKLQTEILPLRSFARRVSWLYRIYLKLRRKSN